MAGTGAWDRVSLMRTDQSASAGNTQSVSLRVADGKGQLTGPAHAGTAG